MKRKKLGSILTIGLLMLSSLEGNITVYAEESDISELAEINEIAEDSEVENYSEEEMILSETEDDSFILEEMDEEDGFLILDQDEETEIFEEEGFLLNEEEYIGDWEEDGEETADELNFSTAVPITCDQKETVMIENVGDQKIYSFTASEDGEYVFCASEKNIIGSLYQYDSEYEEYMYCTYDFLRSGSNQTQSGNGFGQIDPSIPSELKWNLQAGETVYLVTGYLDSLKTGSYSISVEKSTFFIKYAADTIVSPGGDCTLSVQAVSDAEITYQWYDENKQELPGETGAELKLTNIEKEEYYTCAVTSGSHKETAVFFVRVNSELAAHAKNDTIQLVEYGNPAELKISGYSIDPKGLTYTWSGPNFQIIVNSENPDEISGTWYETESWYNPEQKPLTKEILSENGISLTRKEEGTEEVWSLSFDRVIHNGRYQCMVSDSYADATVYYSLTVNSGLTIENERNERIVPYGRKAVFRVNATANEGEELTYQWNTITEKIPGATEPELAVDFVDENDYCYCAVTDAYGTTKYAYFYIYVDTEVEHIAVPKGKSVILTAEDPTDESQDFTWYYYSDEEGDWVVSGDRGPQKNFVPQAECEEWCCEIRKGDTISRKYYCLNVIETQGKQIFATSAQLEISIEQSGESNCYEFTAAADGLYTFSTNEQNSSEIWAVIMKKVNEETVKPIASSKNSENKEFILACELRKGTTYYLQTGYQDAVKTGTYCLTLIKEGDIEKICEEGSHVWGTKSQVRPPSCTQNGENLMTCTVCGMEHWETVKAIDHVFGEWTVFQNPTCTESGWNRTTCTVCGLEKKEEVEETGHLSGEWIISEATCTAEGKETEVCSICGEILQEYSIAKLGHSWNSWKQSEAATVFKAKQQKRSCRACGKVQTRSYGDPLESTIKVTATTLKMQKGQKTTKFIVSGMANGDYVKTWKLSRKGIVTVSGKKKGTCTIKAVKVGSVTLTIKLASGLSKKIRLIVQKKKVQTTAIKGLRKNITIKKGSWLKLKPVIVPVTSQNTVKYSSSNKSKVAVSAKGNVKGINIGTAKITVTAGKIRYDINITVVRK